MGTQSQHLRRAAPGLILDKRIPTEATKRNIRGPRVAVVLSTMAADAGRQVHRGAIGSSPVDGERRSCSALRQHRSTRRKVRQNRADQVAPTADIIELAREFRRYGDRSVTALLGKSSWHENHDWVARIGRTRWRRCLASKGRRETSGQTTVRASGSCPNSRTTPGAIISSRIGPALLVQTGCSTSLTRRQVRPLSFHRLQRLQSASCGRSSFGASYQRNSLQLMKMIQPNSRRSSARGLSWAFGKEGSRRANCALDTPKCSDMSRPFSSDESRSKAEIKRACA